MNGSQLFFVSLYVGLIVLCAVLIVISNFVDPPVRAALLPISSDGFKTVLGALLGSISVMLGQKSR